MKSHPNTGCSSLSLEGICNSSNHFSSYSQSLHSPSCISLGILWISLLNHHWMFTLCSLHHTFRELHLSDFCKKFKPTNYDVIIIISWFEEFSWRFVGCEEKNHIVRFGAILLLPTQPFPCSFTFSFSDSLLAVICCLPKACVPAIWHSPSHMGPRISCRVLHTCFDFLFSIPLSFVNSASISLLTPNTCHFGQTVNQGILESLVEEPQDVSWANQPSSSSVWIAAPWRNCLLGALVPFLSKAFPLQFSQLPHLFLFYLSQQSFNQRTLSNTKIVSTFLPQLSGKSTFSGILTNIVFLIEV